MNNHEGAVVDYKKIKYFSEGKTVGEFKAAVGLGATTRDKIIYHKFRGRTRKVMKKHKLVDGWNWPEGGYEEYLVFREVSESIRLDIYFSKWLVYSCLRSYDIQRVPVELRDMVNQPASGWGVEEQQDAQPMASPTSATDSEAIFPNISDRESLIETINSPETFAPQSRRRPSFWDTVLLSENSGEEGYGDISPGV